jgi:hypothetical protein
MAVVVVTINHRLNVFGFSYLGAAAGADLPSPAALACWTSSRPRALFTTA